MVAGVNVSQEALRQRHTPKEILDARFVYGYDVCIGAETHAQRDYECAAIGYGVCGAEAHAERDYGFAISVWIHPVHTLIAHP